MTGNQHNDNLERFFKANLENYKPSPSDDFWARMVPSIPPKPSVWRGMKSSLWKWAGLGLLLLSLATVAVLWHRDKLEIVKLSKQLAVQQQTAQQGGETAGSVAAAKSVLGEKLPETIGQAGAADQVATAPEQESIPVFTPKTSDAGVKKSGGKSSASAQESAQNFGAKTSQLDLAKTQQITENQLVSLKNIEVEPQFENASLSAASAESNSQPLLENPTENVHAALPAPMFIPFLKTQVSSLKNHAPSVKHFGKKPFRKPYPRISVEGGATAFAMPVSRLFSGDTLYAGRVRPSFSAGFLLHYEISPSISFQGGYQYKDIHTSRLALRYNSFPLLVTKKWAWGRRTTFEARTGITVNSLLNIRTSTDGLSVRGLKPTWLGWQGSLSVGIPVGEQVNLLVGPTFGKALTPIANGRRTWEAGLGGNLRYSF